MRENGCGSQNCAAIHTNRLFILYKSFVTRRRLLKWIFHLQGMPCALETLVLIPNAGPHPTNRRISLDTGSDTKGTDGLMTEDQWGDCSSISCNDILHWLLTPPSACRKQHRPFRVRAKSSICSNAPFVNHIRATLWL